MSRECIGLTILHTYKFQMTWVPIFVSAITMKRMKLICGYQLSNYVFLNALSVKVNNVLLKPEQSRTILMLRTLNSSHVYLNIHTCIHVYVC